MLHSLVKNDVIDEWIFYSDIFSTAKIYDRPPRKAKTLNNFQKAVLVQKFVCKLI
jgi:hypothetical protein